VLKPGPVILELQGVRKRYGSVEALRGLTAAVDGKKVGLLGPNGAGKSTLLRAMLGLTTFEGTALVLGLDPKTSFAKIRDRVGYMPEMDSYLAEMNAVELCAYAGELSGLPRSAAMKRAHAALYYANLEDKRYLKVAGYSTGMKQRVKLAQALVHDPELLFLDEPTNGLDPAGREEMLELIDGLPTRRGCAIILSTHLLPDVERVCDHAIVLHQGALQFAGTLDEMRGEKRPDRYEVRVKDGVDRITARLTAAGCAVEPLGADGVYPGVAVTLPPGAGTDLVFREARAANVQVRHLAPLRATLEAAFLARVTA
jgi:ABC-2 type transport system ATP-binding protein